jgi:hypothetical protein
MTIFIPHKFSEVNKTVSTVPEYISKTGICYREYDRKFNGKR